MQFSLKGKVCWVTGCTRGLGRAFAEAFQNEGANVVVPGIRVDVYDESAVQSWMQEVGPVDVLVNNAGVHSDAVVWRMSLDVWTRVLQTNLGGAFVCTKHVLPSMRQKGWGRIVNVGSVVAETGLVGACNYAASKAGLEGFTKSVAKEVAGRGITVNCVAYGYMNAGMNLRLPEQVRQKVVQGIPLGRFGTLEEAAAPVLFLCSESASYITGQTFHVNGGLV